MLQKMTLNNGVLCYRSSLLEDCGVVHAFSTRIGGVSHGAFASLNLGNPSGTAIRDAQQNITENYGRLLAGLGLTGKKLCRVHQVHGTGILPVQQGDTPPLAQQADALLTQAPEFILSIRTADCVPILVADSTGRHVAAVHAGWRGVVAGILPATLAALQRMGVPIANLRVAIGPCISVTAFEVGQEVADDFHRLFPRHPVVQVQPNAKPHVNLPLAVKLQAMHFGLAAEQVDNADLCTFRDKAMFFSHRRDAELSGRLAAVISPRERDQ